MVEGVLLEMWGNNFLQYLAMLLMLKGHCMLWLVRSSYYTCRMRKAFLVQQTRNSTSYAYDFIGALLNACTQPRNQVFSLSVTWCKETRKFIVMIYFLEWLRIQYVVFIHEMVGLYTRPNDFNLTWANGKLYL